MSHVPQAPARAGVYGTKDGGLVIMGRVRNQPRSKPTEVLVQGSKAASMARQARSLGPPPGFPSGPPPGLTAVDETQVVTQAVVG